MVGLLVGSTNAQLLITSTRVHETQSGTETRATISIFGAPYDNIIGEFLVFLTPGLTPESPTTNFLRGMWNGSPPPVALGWEWVGTPIQPTPGLVYSSTTGTFTGEVVPSSPVFGGAAFGYASMGQFLSGPIEIAVWANPVGVHPSGWHCFFLGATFSVTYGYGYWGVWGEVW